MNTYDSIYSAMKDARSKEERKGLEKFAVMMQFLNAQQLFHDKLSNN